MEIADFLEPNQLRELRVGKNLRQWQLHIMSNVSLPRISQIENGAPATEVEKERLAKGLSLAIVEIWPDLEVEEVGG